MKTQARYQLNKSLKKGDSCVFPSCGANFLKTHYQQAFCKSKTGTKCKDKYWNMVTPNKSNNTTRISPANARWQARLKDRSNFNPDDYEHPFSSEAHGQS